MHNNKKVGRPNETITYENHLHTEVFLQAWVILIRGQSKEWPVQAIIDTDLQWSYILKSTAQVKVLY